MSLWAALRVHVDGAFLKLGDLKQGLDRIEAAALDRQMQWCPLVVVFGVGVRFVLQQDFQDPPRVDYVFLEDAD